MSLNPVKPITDNYELIELSPGAFYRVRKAYSPMVAHELDCAMVATGREEIAKELGVSLNSEEGLRISDDMGNQWYFNNMYYRDVNDLIQDSELIVKDGDILLDEDGNFVTKPKVDEQGEPVMIATLKYRNKWLPCPPITKCIIKTLCKPINGAPDPLSIYDDLTPSEVSKVIHFFYSCSEKPAKTKPPKQESTTDSDTGGVAASEQTNTESQSTKKTAENPNLTPEPQVI